MSKPFTASVSCLQEKVNLDLPSTHHTPQLWRDSALPLLQVQRWGWCVLCRTRPRAGACFPGTPGLIPFDASWVLPDWTARCGRSRGTASLSREASAERPTQPLLTKLLSRTGYCGGGQPICLGVFSPTQSSWLRYRCQAQPTPDHKQSSKTANSQKSFCYQGYSDPGAEVGLPKVMSAPWQ